MKDEIIETAKPLVKSGYGQSLYDPVKENEDNVL